MADAVAFMGLFGSVGNPREIDRTVRAQLADSLTYIVGTAGGYLNVDVAGFGAALANIRAHQQDPGVFARYFDLIFAVNGNQFEVANALLEELIERASQPAFFAIVPYSREALGTDYDRFPKLLFAEFSKANPMASPSPAQTAAFMPMLRGALEDISRVDREIHDEIEAFLTRIYLAVPNKAAPAARFGGATSLLTWGGTFVNIEAYRTRWDAVQFLVHEITHSLLFGIGCEQPLVENSPEESYRSPLRTDARPMDGIFHATLVCARLAAFNGMWLDSGLLAAGDRDRSADAVARNARSFRDGLTVVEEHGKLSAQARDLVDASCRGLSVFA